MFKVGPVLQLLLGRELEHLLPDCELPVHLLLRQPEVDDVEEADLLDRLE